MSMPRIFDSEIDGKTMILVPLGSISSLAGESTKPELENLLEHLQEADLSGTDLRGVNFWQSNLAGADLRNADLRGANLTEADLNGANVSGMQSDQTTVLPDGTTWSQDTDWDRFTDSAHPDFWRSDNPDSPAYQDQK